MAFPERSEKIPGSENFFSGKIVTLNWLHGWSQVIRSFGECVIYVRLGEEKAKYTLPIRCPLLYCTTPMRRGLSRNKAHFENGISKCPGLTLLSPQKRKRNTHSGLRSWGAAVHQKKAKTSAKGAKEVVTGPLDAHVQRTMMGAREADRAIASWLFYTGQP